VIDGSAIAALPPARRAELIYAEARSGLDRQLWQAALGGGGGGGGGGDDASPRAESSVGGSRLTLDALIAHWTEREAARAAPPAAATAAPVAHRVESAAASASVEPPAGLGPNSRHAGVLASAAARTGLPAPALAAIVDAEAAKGANGAWNAMSRNPRSSAAGLGQFLSGTWTGLAEQPGTWLNALADRQGWLGANGRVLPEARGRVLAQRYDPEAAIQGVADFARRNLQVLKRAGVEAAGDVNATARLAYLGHHLGPGDAVRFLRDKGLDGGRARALLDAQVGRGASAERVAAAGGAATAAHREWLMGYLDRKIRPERFAAVGASSASAHA